MGPEPVPQCQSDNLPLGHVLALTGRLDRLGEVGVQIEVVHLPGHVYVDYTYVHVDQVVSVAAVPVPTYDEPHDCGSRRTHGALLAPEHPQGVAGS